MTLRLWEVIWTIIDAGVDILVVIVGPTGVGKTALSIELAEQLHCPIISADSRQIYREMRIGTATPTQSELARVRHYFIGTRSIHEPYSAGQYEADALQIINEQFELAALRNPETDAHRLVMTGGSMMYVDAVCNGFDAMPSVDESVRLQVQSDYEKHGLQFLQNELRERDPEHYNRVDLQNYRRVMRAVEVCRQTRRPYSELRIGKTADRPFKIVKIGLDRPRAELYDRINKRVEQMIEEGLVEEARSLYPYRQLNALNTVGYKELFDFFDGKYNMQEAVRLIKQDSRHYAKRQLTWFRADPEIRWFNADEITKDDIIQIINKQG